MSQQNAFPNLIPGLTTILSPILDDCRICDPPSIGQVEIHTEDSQ